jgi:predicted DsbA family dithiol-disulfide isomerase
MEVEMKVEIYSDVVCPWCYIGERRFARALAAFPGGEEVEVAFRPFQLDAAAPERATPVAEYLARRFGGRSVDGMLARVTQAATEEGITMDWDRALSVNTRTALRLMRLAGLEYGATVQRALMDALFDAHFTRGGDVADHEQLTALAASVGMDADRVRAYLASGKGEAELVTQLGEARANDVHAVPTFVFDGKYVVEGAQPASTFLQVLEEVRRREADAAAEASRDGDADDAAGCEDGACAVAGAPSNGGLA